MYQHIKIPAQGQKITVNADFSLNVPDEPIIPYIEGDGTGLDITPVMLKVVDAAVAKSYGGKRKIHWMEVFAGEKSTNVYGPDVWLPEETLHAIRDYVVSIKGPLTTPVGGGIRSLNVALRQELDRLEAPARACIVRTPDDFSPAGAIVAMLRALLGFATDSETASAEPLDAALRALRGGGGGRHCTHFLAGYRRGAR